MITLGRGAGINLEEDSLVFNNAQWIFTLITKLDNAHFAIPIVSNADKICSTYALSKILLLLLAVKRDLTQINNVSLEEYLVLDHAQMASILSIDGVINAQRIARNVHPSAPVLLAQTSKP